MSLLGVVAGFMTHEFGVALAELESTKQLLDALGKNRPRFAETAEAFAKHIKQLEEFVTYSSGYIRGARTVPKKPYPVMPRLRQVKRVFGKYAVERGIQVQLRVESGLQAPLVPVVPIQWSRSEPVHERTKSGNREDGRRDSEDHVPGLERRAVAPFGGVRHRDWDTGRAPRARVRSVVYDDGVEERSVRIRDGTRPHPRATRGRGVWRTGNGRSCWRRIRYSRADSASVAPERR